MSSSPSRWVKDELDLYTANDHMLMVMNQNTMMMLLMMVIMMMFLVQVDAGEGRSNKTTLFITVTADYRLVAEEEEKIQYFLTDGKGEALDAEAMDELLRVMSECSASFLWEKGDVLLLDNKQVSLTVWIGCPHDYVLTPRAFCGVGHALEGDVRGETEDLGIPGHAPSWPLR
jgi:hypothetical protein